MPFINKFGGGSRRSFGISLNKVPNAPTGLSVSSTTTTTATIAFTAPTNDGGTPITNYEYSLNNSTWTAFSPVDNLTPVTVTGLSANTAYTIYLRAVNSAGSGTGSAGVAATTQQDAPTSLEYLVVAGGGGGSGGFGVGSRVGGGGAGGMLTASGFSVASGQSHGITVGAGGGTANGNNSVFSSVTCIGGGTGARQTYGNGVAGGSGGGASGSGSSGGAGTAGQGNNGGSGGTDTGYGGGGKGSAGSGVSGGSGQASSITGSSVTYAKGGNGWGGGEGSAAANTGNGAGGVGDTVTTGGSGIVVIRYANSFANLSSVSAGLVYSFSNVGGFKIYTFTAGTGTITV